MFFNSIVRFVTDKFTNIPNIIKKSSILECHWLIVNKAIENTLPIA